MSGTPFVVDTRELRLFAVELFKHARPGSFVSLRAMFDGDDRRDELAFNPERVCVAPGLEAVIERAACYAQRCADHEASVVFAPPIATFLSPRSAAMEMLADALTLAVECDARAGEAVAALEDVRGPATIVMASGGQWTNSETGEIEDKLHAHWRLREPGREAQQHEAVRQARALMADLVAADGTAKSPVHPMRWPGSWHRKAKPRLARITALNEDADIDLGETLARLKEVALRCGLNGRDTPSSAGNPDKLAPIEEVALWISGIPNPKPVADTKQDAWEWWNYVGMSLWAATGGSDQGLELFREWSGKNTAYGEAGTNSRWRHYFKHPPTKLGAGTLCYLFHQYWNDRAIDDWQEMEIDSSGAVAGIENG